ncbi:MAG: hypothetical protein PHX08_14615 [Lachnospiraceae bacterium]|nr:hypothetical protein [Lachnospiraceae bacterium]
MKQKSICLFIFFSLIFGIFTSVQADTTNGIRQITGNKRIFIVMKKW